MSILSHFSKTVGDYDTVADKVVFKNEELHAELVATLPFQRAERLQILDLGCGTGHGVEMILKAYPHALVTGIDFSSRMIHQARKRLVHHARRVELIEADFTKLPLERTYDAVVSAVAIHNVSDTEKEKLFRRIAAALRKGGVFINGDFYRPETKQMREQLSGVYENFLKKNLSGAERATWLHHVRMDDKPMALSKQFSTLRKVGFAETRLIWLHNNEAVYAARK